MIAALPRILLVTRNLPPLVGGMERLNWHMADELSRHGEVRVIGPAGAAAVAPAQVPVDEVPLQPLSRFLIHAQWKALAVARRWRPDVVLAGSGLTAPAAWLAARMSGARAAVYVHGLDIVVPHAAYRAVWHPVLRRMDRVIANSSPTVALAQQAGIDPARIGVVHPGVQLPGEPGDGEVSGFRIKHDLGNRPLLLSVGRLSARKGLREFVEHALPRIASVYPDVVLLVVGDTPKQALHAQAQTPESIRAVAEQAGVAGNLLFLGSIPDSELESALRAANVHVFPVREIPGDPEGFGMVAIEAAAHGLPTVAFASGGVVDAVADGQSGYLVPPGDYATLAEKTCFAIREQGSLRPACLQFAEQFSWQHFGTRIAEQWGPSPVLLSPGSGSAP